MKRKLIAILILITVFFSTACSDTKHLNPIEPKEPEKQETDESPQSGGTVSLATTSNLNLDPLMANDEETKAILSIIYEGLVRIDGKGMLQPALAESWQIDEDGKTYTINLRTDVKWHNGETFSAADVKATFDRIKELKKSVKKGERPDFAEFDNIQSYEALDKNTLIISLYKPDADFLYGMTRGILSASFIETLKTSKGTEKTASEYIGTGPFKVVSKSSDSVSLRRNDDYFGEKPYIEGMNIKIFPDNTAIKEAFNKRAVDMINIEPEDWNVFHEMEDVYLLQYPSRYFEFIAVNLTNPILSDVNVRQAMLMGIDRNRILQDTTLGRGLVIDGPILPYSWAFNSSMQQIMYNKRTAAQKLKEAGWEDTDDDGILEKTIGKKKYKLEFELLVNTSNGARYQTASHIEKDLKDLGISVKLTNVTWDELKSKVMSKKYDTAVMGWKLAPNPDLQFMFASSEIKNGYNFVSYSNPELDDILIRAKTDYESKKELLYEAQEIINRDLPYLFLYSPNEILALNKRLKGVEPDPINLFNNINEWWIKQ